MRPIALYRDVIEDPALDIAISRALMDMVAEGFPYDTLRIYQPSPMLALGKLDRLSDGYDHIINYCRQINLQPVIRIAGGRAALFHERSLALAWARRESASQSFNIDDRLEPLNKIYIETLSSFGIDARQGQLEGEYCPGDSTINARGQVKLIGTGQRAVSGCGHLGSVITAEDSLRIAELIEPVYQAMDHPFDRSTCGSVEEEVGIDLVQLREGLISAFADQYEVVEMKLPLGAFRRARDLIDEHRIY